MVTGTPLLLFIFLSKYCVITLSIRLFLNYTRRSVIIKALTVACIKMRRTPLTFSLLAKSFFNNLFSDSNNDALFFREFIRLCLNSLLSSVHLLLYYC